MEPRLGGKGDKLYWWPRQGKTLGAKFCSKEKHLFRLEKLEKASERRWGGGLYLVRNGKGTRSMSQRWKLQ